MTGNVQKTVFINAYPLRIRLYKEEVEKSPTVKKTHTILT